MPVITYSPAFTLVPTYECFNRCTYCNFREDIGSGAWLSLAAAAEILNELQGQEICEILILAGEVAPQSPQRQAWLEHIYQLGELALNFGFLPHTNSGVLSYAELAYLKTVNVSQGLMLEQVTPRLLTTVHRQAPTKKPRLRIEHLNQAGRLNIPCTTGLLLGIGETSTDRIDTLNVIAALHHRWGHIQEVILQPYSPGPNQYFPELGFDLEQLPDLIYQARKILPADITLQIPPNLIPSFDLLLACLDAGARDLGGLVPYDHVNPAYPHAEFVDLKNRLSKAGWQLHPRLPIYPQYLNHLPSRLQTKALAWQARVESTALSRP